MPMMKTISDFSFRLPLAAGLVTLLALAGCNSGSLSDGLSSTSASTRQTIVDPVAPAQNVGEQQGSEQAFQQQGQQQPVLQGGSQQTASLGESDPVAFLPVTGAPQTTVTTLANAMRQQAQTNKVQVVSSLQAGARYQVKGYFSALNDSGTSQLVYVWDVLDSNGVRVHRISGQERGIEAGGDPWVGITEDVLRKVAATTMASLRSWMSTRNRG